MTMMEASAFPAAGAAVLLVVAASGFAADVVGNENI